ncbi:hypothetical protein T458_13390 [Brevibacillus panacihumi W25]|uniref:Lipoprotein n=1 Tax=Brevibacillus panacihumi W25 TaxID=1408254 RepID=V6M8L6_9BACL|nr:hypothetical protein [Brevibacillus panacihumi]EST54602.1 hypothetical protein T458_13390 [Brevibacillus panacihumi W25]
MKYLPFCLFFLLVIGCVEKDTYQPVVDRDAIVDRINYIHDFNSAEEFDTTELMGLQHDPGRKDYKIVLTDYFTNVLKQEMESFQTMSTTNNLRHILVITKDKVAYRVDLKQWEEFQNIWTVDMYGTADIQQ